MYNTLLIKRRLASSSNVGLPILSGGELAFDEKLNILYYGQGLSPTTTIAIAGSGAYVTSFDNGIDQNIYGPKTFNNHVTLSSTDFAVGSVINANGNAIHTVACPLPIASGVKATQPGTDAANVAFVQNLSSWLDTYYVNRGVDGQVADQSAAGVKTWNDNANFQKQVVVTGAVHASAARITQDLFVGGDTTLTGNLSVLGYVSQIDTLVHMTSAMDITNTGSGPALKVTQTGANDIATFYDDANTALIIKDGGNIGIGLATPSEKLTVVGNVSANGNYSGVNGTLTGTLSVSQLASFANNVSIALHLSGAPAINGMATSRLIDWVIDCGTF